MKNRWIPLLVILIFLAGCELPAMDLPEEDEQIQEEQDSEQDEEDDGDDENDFESDEDE